MFNRIRNIWKKLNERDIIVVANSAMTKEQAAKLGKDTNKVVVMVNNVNDVKIFEVPKEQGDGKAEFFSDPTAVDEIEYQREIDGTKPWYKRLQDL